MPVPLQIAPETHNFVFLGEAGCGKSEIAVNLAMALAERGDKEVHFFDLDMTKPLFRSRDVTAAMEAAGIIVHFEVQFMDAPTVTGGVSRQLRDSESYTVMDVGGDYIGARAVGGYAPLLNREETAVFYVVNPFRPWSMNMEHIDGVLSQVLGMSHVRLEKLRFVGNPNMGVRTTAEDVRLGAHRLEETLDEVVPVAFFCAREEFCPVLEGKKVFPLRQLYLTYPWESPDTEL